MRMSPLIFLSLLLVSFCYAGQVSVTRSNLGGVYAPGDLIFEDNFDSLNLTKWNHEININGGGNNEFQIYDTYPDNSYVKDGALYIKPSLSLDTVFGGDVEKLYNGFLKLEGCTDPPGSACERQASYPNINHPTVSARLRTKGNFAFTYGHVQVRARIPGGDWTWPAIWMMPEESKYGGWPASGEIDIMESVGNRDLVSPNGDSIGSEHMGSTMHFGPFWPHNAWWAAHGTKNSPSGQGYDRDFHLYELFWTTTGLRFTVDGAEIVNVVPPAGGFFELGKFGADLPNPWVNGTNPRMAPFDSNFHIILNVAIGGNFFSKDSIPPPPWLGNSTVFLNFFNDRANWLKTWQGDQHAMAIDYVRVYAI